MKKVLTVSVLLAAVFCFSTCSGPYTDPGMGAAGGDGGGGYVGGGETLTLSGQVVTKSYPTDYSIVYTNYTGDGTIQSTFASIFTTVTGGITRGKLNVTFGAPKASNLGSISSVIAPLSQYYDNITGVPSDAKGGAITRIPGTAGGLSGSLYRELETYRGGTNGTDSKVYYFYFDKAITLSGKGKTTASGKTSSDFSFALKQGWNAIGYEFTGNMDGGAGTITIFNNDPNSLKWVLR